MTFTRTQKQTAFKKLSSEIQDIILSTETTELISQYLKDSNLSEDHIDLAETEILNSMCGLQTLSEAISNISKLTGKNTNDFSKLKSNLEDNIFSKIISGNNRPIQDLGKNKAILNQIAEKYSLSREQTEILLQNGLSLLSDPKNPKVSLEALIKSLNISSLLAEQIASELESRVFESAVNQKTERKPVSESTPSRIPEIRPDNMPIERTAAITQVPKYTPPQAQASNALKGIETPRYMSSVTSEPVQKPMPVPRINAMQMEQDPAIRDALANIEGKTTPPPNNPTQDVPKAPTPSIMESKLQNVTKGMSEPAPTAPPVKEYSVDPYREPLN